ncbi:MAG: ABC-2 family transporter protein [Anaerolineales bacterium]|nr:ABC-2 family transporter protein [Anaerolineales bacterium]
MRELKFLLAVWKTNIASAMEYRAAFIAQMLGMILNNAVYFIFWVIFFDRFRDVRGWELSDMFLVFGVAASAFGLAAFLFGNAFYLSEIIARGRLDYYLSLPRPILLHTVASRSISSGLGDFTYGILSYLASGYCTWDGFGRFLCGVVLACMAFTSFMIIVHSLTFWLGNAAGFAGLALNAMVTFALYPVTLFEGFSKLILFTIVPAALMGALPAEFVRAFSWGALGKLFLGALLLLGLAVLVFHRGLRRYESGSAIQVEV